MVRLFLLLSLFLAACTGASGLNLGYYPDPDATRSHFNLCHGYGCTHQTETGFTDKEWKKIKKIFRAKSKTPEAERQKIAKAIALMERYTGERVGTKVDLPKAPIKKVSDMELDCIDETINTTKYLTFLQDDGLLKFHSVGNPVYKGMFINGVYPHNSASVRENESGDIYVIDSYIYKNGEEPNIRPLDNWVKYRVEDLEKIHNETRAAAENIKR
ncbi:MAG TPA: hypothetical protein PLF01_05205 [Alphaproteobacteria bacterium]|nr:hypothetical protein [Alphaproteobacteria bacterium]